MSLSSAGSREPSTPATSAIARSSRLRGDRLLEPPHLCQGQAIVALEEFEDPLPNRQGGKLTLAATLQVRRTAMDQGRSRGYWPAVQVPPPTQWPSLHVPARPSRWSVR